MASSENNEKSELNNIYISVEGAQDAFKVSDDSLMLHRPEFLRVLQLMDQTYEKALSREETAKGAGAGDKSPQRTHDTIFLSGMRGTGKTTFILSLMDFFENGEKTFHNDDIRGLCIKFRNTLCVLDMIDPTTIEERENILVLLIARIHAEVLRSLRERELGELPEDYANAMYSLADGLELVDGLGREEWLDRKFILDQDIGKALAGGDLVWNFHLFVGKALNVLNKKAFLLCLDDIDTNFGKGRKVIEVLHKFLTTPKIITILSGDFMLYSTLVRGSQWDNYTHHFVDVEMKVFPEKKYKYDQQVTILEQQYMLKIFRPDRRVPLTNVYRKTELGQKVYLLYKDEEPREIRKEYRKIFTELSVTSDSELNLYSDFISTRPIRIQKQFINLYRLAISKREENQNNSGVIWNSEQSELLAQGIADIFWSDLHENGFNEVYELKNASDKIVVLAMNYLIERGLIADGSSLRPVFDKDSVNGTQFAMGFLLSLRLNQKPWLIFDYLVKICAIREMRNLLGTRGEGQSRQQPSLENVLEVINVQQGRKSYFAKLLTTYFAAYHLYEKALTPRKLWHGIIPLKDLASKSGGMKQIGAIDSVFEGDAGKRMLAYLPLSGVQTFDDSMPVYSFINLLGCIEDVLYAVQKMLPDEVPPNVVQTALNQAAVYSEYPVPPWASRGNDLREMIGDNKTPIASTESPKLNPAEIARGMVRWALKAGELQTSYGVERSYFKIVALDLARIYMRTFISHNKHEEKMRGGNTLGSIALGKVFQEFVAEFLNAIVAVCVQNKYINNAIANQYGGLNFNNAVGVNKFIENIIIIMRSEDNENGDKAITEFGRWMLQCPIWQAYFSHKELQKVSMDFYGELLVFLDWELNISIYDDLEKVHLRSGPPVQNDF